MVNDAHAAGIPLQITSAYRSPEVQARLYENALKKYGSPQAARKWVAPPGRSQHNHGTAVDFAVNGSLLRDANDPAAQWIKSNAAQYGLDVPMSWEPWQVEMAGARGQPKMAAGGTKKPMQQQTKAAPSQPQPEQPKGSRFWNELGFLKDPDKRAKLAIALEGMTLNPNQALIDMNRAEIEGRAAKGRTNRTAEWLRANGSDDLAGAIEAGVLDGQQAIGLHYQRQQPQGADPTSGMRNYEFLLAQGVDPAEAMERSFGAGGTNVQVTTGNQGPQVGTIPQGYQMAQDPETGAYRMEPIPGGPEDTTQTDANRAENQAAGATNVLGVVEDLRKDIMSWGWWKTCARILRNAPA